MPFEAILHGVLTQPVPFVHSMRQVKLRLPPQARENFQQKRSRGYAIHVVIAKDDHALALFPSTEQSLDRDFHLRQQKRIGQLLEARFEKAADLNRVRETAIDQ